MSNVFQFGDLQISRAARSYAAKDCKHMLMELDYEGQVVMCLDCKKQVSAFWALSHYVKRWERMRSDLDSRIANVARVEQTTLHLKAAQKVESAWRSKSMVPVCPHCREAIFQNDGLGGSMINKEIAERRRKVLVSIKSILPEEPKS